MSKKIVVKQNELIDNFIFNATELELQIMNYAVAVTNPTWQNKNLVYRIDIPELVVTYKTKANNMHEQYKKALNRLMKREISFYVGQKKHTQNIVVEYIEDMEDTSYLVFKFNEYISTRISRLKGLFTQYDIKHIANFKSRYAFLLYEYFKMKLELDNNKITGYQKEYLISDFKEKLDITGKYKVFAMLETYVLKPAKENINKHSDLHIEYKVKRKARTPISIVFKARYKSNSLKLKAENFKLVKEVETLITPYGLTERTEEDKKNSKKNLDTLKGMMGLIK